MCSELGRDPGWEEAGLSEMGDEGFVGVEGGRGERGVEEEVMLRARTEAARRTTGGEGVRELSGSKVQCIIVCNKTSETFVCVCVCVCVCVT